MTYSIIGILATILRTPMNAIIGLNSIALNDAVLIDVRMPEMDGLEATRVIRSMDREDAKSIPIIALTANAFDEDVQNSLQAGLNAHLNKPVEPETVFRTLEELL